MSSLWALNIIEIINWGQGERNWKMSQNKLSEDDKKCTNLQGVTNNASVWLCSSSRLDFELSTHLQFRGEWFVSWHVSWLSEGLGFLGLKKTKLLICICQQHVKGMPWTGSLKMQKVSILSFCLVLKRFNCTRRILIWASNLRFALLVGHTSPKASIRPGQLTLCGVSLDCRRGW